MTVLPPPAPRVAIAVHGRYHAFDLGSELHRAGALVQVATTYPAFAARRFLPAGVRLATAPWLEVWRRLSGRLPLVPPPDPGLSKAFARFAARTLPDGANLLVGWSSTTLEAIAPARDRALAVVLERGSTHIGHQTEILADAAGGFSAPLAETPPEMIEREVAEYELADAIAVPTRYAARTFIERGVPADKMLVLPYGTAPVATVPERAAPKRAEQSGPLRVLFAGGVGLRKGVPWLLRAVDALKGAAVLDLAGPLAPGMDAVLAREQTRHATFHGPLDRARLERLYARADVFCLPSLEDGFGLVLLEAMARGLPIVASAVTGGSELVDGEDCGLLVPPGDAAALAAALDRLAGDAETRLAMGRRARAKIDADFTWARYGERVLAAYRGVLERSGAP